MKDFDPKCKPTRPVLRYHGGKWRTAPWIISHFPAHKTYVEPFGGAGSVLMQKERSPCEIYNDLDGEIVNVFRVLRSRGGLLKKLLRLTPYSREEFTRCYEPCRNEVERARRAMVRAFMAYGGNGVHKKKGFNLSNCKSSGPEKSWDTLPEALDATIHRLKKVIVENKPAIELIQRVDSKHTLHYVDPPYLPSTRDAGDDYRHEMTTEDHVELADVLHSLQGSVVLSGYPDPLYKRLFKGWKTYERKTHCESNAERTEKIWIKPA